ncbi:MAG: HK97 gp10 family phage protein [Pyramidobacter sp.]|nr:HK97 gp10 family phage protein [Clostridia bacterium]MBR1895502.1 HK97 gp10 family phage protein [Pyramidobacter sp.]
MSVQIVNSTRILRALKECPQVMEKVIAEELDKTAELIVAEAKRLAPKSKPEDGPPTVYHGALKDSIKKTETTAQNGRIRVKVFADYPDRSGRMRHKTKTKKQSTKGRVYYAFAVEYGTKHMKARPFLKPAARKYGGDELAKRITSNMDLVLEKEFKK